MIHRATLATFVLAGSVDETSQILTVLSQLPATMRWALSGVSATRFGESEYAASSAPDLHGAAAVSPRQPTAQWARGGGQGQLESIKGSQGWTRRGCQRRGRAARDSRGAKRAPH